MGRGLHLKPWSHGSRHILGWFVEDCGVPVVVAVVAVVVVAAVVRISILWWTREETSQPPSPKKGICAQRTTLYLCVVQYRTCWLLDSMSLYVVLITSLYCKGPPAYLHVKDFAEDPHDIITLSYKNSEGFRLQTLGLCERTL